jgi:hypothetical protein
LEVGRGLDAASIAGEIDEPDVGLASIATVNHRIDLDRLAILAPDPSLNATHTRLHYCGADRTAGA